MRISAESAKPAKLSAKRGIKFRKPPVPAMSTVFRILIETNMNSKSTKSTKTGVGFNKIHPCVVL